MNHVEKARSRILWQYRNSPKFRAWIETLPALAQREIKAPLQAIADLLDLDNTSGELLDIVGRIVGATRDYEGLIGNDFYQFGEARAQFGGSRVQFRLVATSMQESVADDLYRTLIRAKIAHNSSDATIDDIARIVAMIADGNVVTVEDHQDMSFSVVFWRALTPIQRFSLKHFGLVPRPQGVRLRGYVEVPAVSQFGRGGFGRTQFSPYYINLGGH